MTTAARQIGQGENSISALIKGFLVELDSNTKGVSRARELPPFEDVHGHTRYRAGYCNFASDGVLLPQDVVTSGFLIFAIGEAIISSTAAMDYNSPNRSRAD
jgi:hypothetical protein